MGVDPADSAGCVPPLARRLWLDALKRARRSCYNGELPRDLMSVEPYVRAFIQYKINCAT